jgi:hypothetical protein
MSSSGNTPTTTIPDELQSGHEAALKPLIAARAGKSPESDWALVRALVHRAVHIAQERKAGEFCAVATLLAEMIGHAHEVMHTADRSAPAHTKDVH